MSEKNIVLTKQQIVDGETFLKVLCLILVMFGLVVLGCRKTSKDEENYIVNDRFVIVKSLVEKKIYDSGLADDLPEQFVKMKNFPKEKRIPTSVYDKLKEGKEYYVVCPSVNGRFDLSKTPLAYFLAETTELSDELKEKYIILE